MPLYWYQTIFFLFSALGFCIATIVFQDETDTNPKEKADAIYIGISFFDAFLNCCNGLVVFGLFGLETSLVIDPLVKWVGTIQDLYYKRPLNADDPRLYHWTLRISANFIDLLPAEEQAKPGFSILAAVSTVPVNPPRIGHPENQDNGDRASSNYRSSSTEHAPYLRASFTPFRNWIKRKTLEWIENK